MRFQSKKRWIFAGIRQLQIFLAKVALIVGVQIHDSVTFRNLIFPKSHNSGCWYFCKFENLFHILIYSFIYYSLILLIINFLLN